MSMATGSEAPRVGPLHPKRLAKMTAAIAGLTCALSVLAGVIAARAAPHGLRGIAVSLHLAHQPLIVKVAAGITSLAVVSAAVSGLLHFYSWWQEHELD
ncbi:MAG TPA: hypothetical protein VK700_13970 [Steroidobacteraceae bacterium]|jgi:hypothetical protein|nr:hypothetical protein [Steroidobacteraceae bacterium]